jgi:glycopeptide antibiotics resistance protein
VDTDYVGGPPILPGLVLAFIASILLTPLVARRLRVWRLHAWLLLISLGVILAVTLTPSRAAVELGVQGTVGCDLSRIGPGSWSTYARIDDPILNVLVFIPLGAAIGFLPPSRARRWILLGAVLLPITIETTQAFVVVLDRACQGGDVFDNLAGLVIGLAIGLVAGSVWRRVWSRAPDWT